MRARAPLLPVLLLLRGALAADPAAFVSDRGVALRDSPRDGRVTARLALGTTLVVLAREGGWLRVEVPSAGRSGWVSSGAAALFDDGAAASHEMAVVGRFLAGDPARRPLAVALLAGATSRLRREGRPDALAEVVLGEAAEALAAAGVLPPEGVSFTARFDPSTGRTADVYSGEAFRSALESLACGGAGADVRDRARAGALRARFPFPSSTLGELLEETAAWIELVETAEEAGPLDVGAARLGEAAPRLGRLLLAASRPEDLGRLAARAGELASRRSATGARLASCVELLGAMRGDGTRPFPQAAFAGTGPLPLAATIEGEIGALTLRVTAAGPGGAARSIAGPLLPVPGSLRLSPDGRTASWLEVAAPTRIVPAVASLDGGGAVPPDAALLAGGRLARDRGRRNVVVSRIGYGATGDRLALSVRAWDDVPPAEARIAVVSVWTGELVLDASASGSSRARYRETMSPPRRRPRGARTGS